MGISATDDMLKDNPHIERLVNGAPGLVGALVIGLPGWWVQGSPIKNIRANPTSALANTYGAEGCKIRCGEKFGAKT